ncbi:hypothetical protein F7C95_17265 [Opitutia bacterium ISCC 51]|nr:hypothetical protein F7C95_17265 [Opitutae bacterium ISCC 51]QXD27721.1 hypothetical protein GA003_17165 [Opitutae bacterium ISCC 52]
MRFVCFLNLPRLNQPMRNEYFKMGNTMLNYCGIRTEDMAYTVDRSPAKAGKLTPGMCIPVFSPDKIAETKPDYVFILPWNLKEEISEQMSHIREWGGKFVVPIPELNIF